MKNLLLPVPNTKTLETLEEREVNDPSPRKILKDRTIYLSTVYNPGGSGLPLISDFGEARFGDVEKRDDIMPNMYRAPEVVLKENWNYKVDIWNVAMVVRYPLETYTPPYLHAKPFIIGMGHRNSSTHVRRQKCRWDLR